MGQQQQTVLRAELNSAPTTGVGINNLSIQITGTGGFTGSTLSGAGTTNDPYIGTINSNSTGNIDWIVTLHNLGSNGTLYYNFVLPDYTGTTTNLFNYNIKCSYNGNQSFIEYAVSDIQNNSFQINENDYVSFEAILNSVKPTSTFKIWFVPDNILTNQLVTYQVLDLYSNIPITINKSFAELEDISKRNSDYSVGLLLPGSKKNNRFFENYYDVDSATLFFNVTKRVPIKVLINDECYLNGYMRLNKVNVLDSKIEYDVTLFTSVADFYGQIGNNLLKDLNFDNPNFHFNHYFTLYNILSNWQNNLLLTSNNNNMPLIFYPALHNGYVYSGDTPNVSGGTVASQSRYYTSTVVGAYTDYAAFTAAGGSEYYINSPKKPVLDNQLKPALSVWGLIELMFKTYGYTICFGNSISK